MIRQIAGGVIQITPSLAFNKFRAGRAADGSLKGCSYALSREIHNCPVGISNGPTRRGNPRIGKCLQPVQKIDRWQQQGEH
jgi:hypothetical protein